MNKKNKESTIITEREISNFFKEFARKTEERILFDINSDSPKTPLQRFERFYHHIMMDPPHYLVFGPKQEVNDYLE